MTADDPTRGKFINEGHRLRRDHSQKTASTHNQRYGRMEPTHVKCVHDFLAAVEPGQEILDAACGTGNTSK